MSRTPEEVLRTALFHFERLQQYAARDLDDEVVIDAICMRLSAGIEALTKLHPDVAERLFGDSWADMWGMRNRIAHGYLLVNRQQVRQTVEDDLPDIVGVIKAELVPPGRSA